MDDLTGLWCPATGSHDRSELPAGAQLGERIAAEPELELLAPISLNIVCFRYCGRQPIERAEANRLNTELVIALQESGIAAPSSTEINGHIAVRAALFNHRTTRHEIDALCAAALDLARKIQIAGE